MENSFLYIKNQICEDFIKENQNNFPFLVSNIEPNILPSQFRVGGRLREIALKFNVLDKKASTGYLGLAIVGLQYDLMGYSSLSHYMKT